MAGAKSVRARGQSPAEVGNYDDGGIRGGGTSRGRVLGHRADLDSDELIGCREARWRIYLPAYHFVLTEW